MESTDIESLLESLGVVGIIATASVFLLKKIFELVLNRDLEKFKSDLEKESIVYKIRYENLQGERLGVIKTTYQKLSKTNRAFKSMMAPLQYDVTKQAKLKRRERASQSTIDLINYFEDNRIFFDEELAKSLDNILDEFEKLWVDFQYIEDIRESDATQSITKWNESWNYLRDEIPKIKNELENKFRNIIGIE